MKALELLKECKELLLDVTIEKNCEIAKTGISWIGKFDEAIAELEAMRPKTCEGCRYGRFGIDRFGLEIECLLAYSCSRGQDDRYEPKEKQ